MASLSGFGVRVMVASYNNFGSIPPPFSLLEEFENWYIFFLYVWQNSPVKSSSPGLLFLENHFLNQIFDFSSNNCCVQIIYFFLIQFWWAIYFQKFVHFQVVQFVDTQLFIVFSYSFFFFFFFLCIYVVLNVISLKFLVLLIWVLSLFFLVSWPEVCWVCLPFQKSRDFGFIDFSISLLFISSLILIIFFFLLT